MPGFAKSRIVYNSVWVLGVSGLANLPASSAQSTPKARPQFEVASVRPVDPASRETINMHRYPGGRVTATGVTLRFLINMAYGVQDMNISGGPGWLGRTRFDIVAQGSEDTDLLPLMLQSLLEDRFKLAIRHESRDLLTYALLLATTGKYGPNPHEAGAGDCTVEPPPTPAQIKSALWTPCGAFHSLRGHLGGKRVTLQNLASPLAAQVGRPVLDETGVPGRFDLNLDWTPDADLGVQGDKGQAAPVDGASIFTALREQLGLRLESRRAAVEFLVIDRAEQPSD